MGCPLPWPRRSKLYGQRRAAQYRTLGTGALGVSACVAWCGPIGFVGLIVSQIVRISVGVPRRILPPMSIVLGATLLVLCDTVARVILPGCELPVGVLTAAIGAPTLIWLVVRKR